MIKAGVIGWPIEQSKSPIIHHHWLDQHKISGSYEKIALAPDAFISGIGGLITQGFSGVNITIPHKINALEIADKATQAAREIGAANSLTFIDGKIHADNTDGYGFIANIMQMAPNWNASAGPALILGAGGAARAVIYSLINAGVPELILANRTRTRAQTLADRFGPKVMVADWADIISLSNMLSMVVNTTSLGMIGQDSLEFDVTHLSANCLVSDIVYNPLQTPLIRAAKRHGCQTVDGLGMLLHQAVPSFNAWFGTRPQVDQTLRHKVISQL